MSTSAADHYRLARAREKLTAASDARHESKYTVEYWEEALAEVQAGLENARMEQERCAAAELIAKEEVEEAKPKAESSTAEKPVQVDPLTGLPPGEKIPMTLEQATFAAMVLAVRKCMGKGDLDKARSLEQEATKLQSQLDFLVDPRALGSGAFQVNHADFIKPFSMPTDEVLNETFSYARNHENKTQPFQNWRLCDNFDSMLSILTGNNPSLSSKRAAIINEIRQQRRLLETAYREEGAQTDSGSEEERAQADSDDEDEELHDEIDEDTFEMTEAAWDSVETAIRNRIAQSREKNDAELTLPHEDSSPICRYNPSAHFLFASDQARESVDVLDDALICCKLRNRPVQWNFEQINTHKRMRTPFEYNCPGSIKGFDVDGDCIATCGDMEQQDFLRSFRTYVAHRTVPCAVNVDSAKTIDDLKDATTGSFQPWDTDVSKLLFEGSREGKTECFSSCIADASNHRVWAASSRTGTVHSFAAIDGVESADRRVGLLAFDPVERKAQRKFLNSHFEIARCGNHIVGSAGTNRLSVWKMQEAVEEFPGWTDLKDARGSQSSDQESEEQQQKKLKYSSYKGLAPRILSIEDCSFASGDVQPVSDTQVLVGPARSGTANDKFSSRLFDIQSESVVGIFCGSQDTVSIEKQYCVESSDMIFSADSGVGVAWDLRTFQPTIMLHTGARFIRVLGVPGTSSTCAFTFGPSLEEIACWDLRMPASHAYTMATGNSEVSSLFWHDRTSSLLAATRSKHTVTHGKSGGEYMYGEPLSWEEQEATWKADWWPPGAQHEPDYFGHSGWHCGGPVILQYPFENGKAMGTL